MRENILTFFFLIKKFNVNHKLTRFEICFQLTGEPGRLIRERYRTASQVVQNQVRSFATFTVDICMSRAMKLNSFV